MKGRIHSIQSLGTLDGPGVRFVVFMQGCPLRCIYCHNPDTWDISGGQEISAKELFKRILSCREYFGKKGGVTVSGGEPLLQAEFVTELFDFCKRHGIHTTLDTSGCIYNEAVDRLLDKTDLVMLDYKFTNPEDYKKYTLCDMGKVNRFLKRLEEKGINTWIRQVIVTGLNDNPENLSGLFSLTEFYKCIEKIELLPFKKSCEFKYKNLNIKFPCSEFPDTSETKIKALSALLSVRPAASAIS